MSLGLGPLPKRIKKSLLKKAVRVICFGLDTSDFGSIILDNEFFLEGLDPSNEFLIIPQSPSVNLTYDQGSFYADCLSFEHEIPTLAMPITEIKMKDIPWFFKPPIRKDLVSVYFEYLINGCDVGSTITNGLFGTVVFKYDYFETKQKKNVDGLITIKYEKRYGDVRVAIHLYNAALRQTDSLMQYLCFYRVIENLAGNKHFDWLQNKIEERALDYKDPVWISVSTAVNRWNRKWLDHNVWRFIRKSRIESDGKLNFLEIMRAYAMFHLLRMKQALSTRKIVERLYNGNRCCIAHGRVIKRHEFNTEYVSILKDVVLMRYLARLIIEENL